jgi:hypothetical protein
VLYTIKNLYSISMLTILTPKMVPGIVFYARTVRGPAGPIRSYKIDKYNKYVCLWCTHGLICRLCAPPNSWNCDYYIGGRRGEAHTAMSSSEHDHPSHATWPLCTSYNGRRLV